MTGPPIGADGGGEDPMWDGLPDPDDRLWRHPSELAHLLPAAVRRRPTRAAFGVLAGACVGAGLAAAAMVLLGSGASDVTADTSNSASGRAQGDGAVTIPARLGTVAPAGAASDAGVGPRLYSPLSRFTASVVNVEVDAPNGAGSGCGFSLDGGNTVVTTAGLVGDATDVYITPVGGQRAMAVVLGTDEMTGVAVLRVSSATFPALSAPDGAVSSGDVVMSYTPHTTPPVAVGEVTGVGVDGTGPNDEAVLDAVATDLPVGVGGLGAPVFDSHGNAVGMVVSATPGQSTLVVPMTRTRLMAAELARSGAVEHGWLGVSGVVSTSAGVAVVEVEPNSPAAMAGITAGSVIVAVDGRPVHTVADLWNQVTMRRPGDAVEIDLETSSRTEQLRVVLGRAVTQRTGPQPAGSAAARS